MSTTRPTRWRRAARGFALATVAGALSLVMIVTTPPPEANALVVAPLIPVALSGGAASGAVAGSALVATGPIAVAVGVGALGYYLYQSHRDGEGLFAPGALFDKANNAAPTAPEAGVAGYCRSIYTSPKPIAQSPYPANNDVWSWSVAVTDLREADDGCTTSSASPGVNLGSGYNGRAQCRMGDGTSRSRSFPVNGNGSYTMTACRDIGAVNWINMEIYYSYTGADGRFRGAGFFIANPNDERNGGQQIKVNTTCSNPQTGETTVVTATGGNTEVIPQAPCPEGWIPGVTDFFAVDETTGGTRSLGKVINNAATTYPACAVAGCTLRVLLDAVPCRVDIAECYDWLQLDVSRLACMFGPYSVGLADCEVLEYGYRTEGGLGFNPKEFTENPKLVPTAPGSPEPDPRYGPGTVKVPATNPNPSPGPTAEPTPSPSVTPSAPPTATGTAPPSPTSLPPPDPAPPTGDGNDGCLSTTVSWNPVSWVYAPVKCALLWAFVPPPGTLTTAVGQTADVVESRPPASLVPALVGPVVGLVGGAVGGCGGALADFGGGLVIPCSPGSSGWSTTLYGIASAAIVIATGFAGWRLVESALSKDG